MLDLAFLILFIYIIYKANHGTVNDTVCDVALVIGILAGIAGLVMAFLMTDSGIWGLNIIVMLMACFLKRTAKHFAYLYNKKIEDQLEQNRKLSELHRRDFDTKEVYNDENFDDPKIRFGGGNGENWF